MTFHSSIPVVRRDHFEPEESGHGLSIPCCWCTHRHGLCTEEPCRTCDHNAGAASEDEENTPA